jgi:hypothetical protein
MRIRRIALAAAALWAAFLLPGTAVEAADYLSPLPKQRFEDSNGNACTGCKLFTYQAGSTTKQSTFTDSTGGTPNANPIVLDTRGEANVWLPATQAFKYTLAPSTDTDPPSNPIWTVDQIQASAPYNPAAVAITGGTLSGVAITGSTWAGGTISNATIATPTITGGTWTGGTISGASVAFTDTGYSANHTVATSDCGKVLSLGGGTQWTLSFPAASGFPAGCILFLSNDDAHAKIISGVASGLSGTYRIYPKQLITVVGDATAWISDGPRRYTITGPTLYAATTGSDSYDCLDAATPCQNINTIVSRIFTDFDVNAGKPTIQLADGTYTEQVNVTAPMGGGANQIEIDGNAATPTNTTINAPAASSAVFVRDYGIVTLKNLQVTCTAGPQGIESTQFAVVDAINLTMGPCDGNAMFVAGDGGHINLESGIILGGNAGVAFQSVGSGSLITAGGGQTMICTSPLILTTVLAVDAGGNFNTEGLPLNFSGCGGVIGKKYSISANGVASTSGSVMPGGTAGTTATGGIYN